jgi:predicted Zn-ribbon and HTH transcriptional regulator
VLWEKVVALNKAKDHEAALGRLVPVVSTTKEKKEVLDELAQATEEVKKRDQDLTQFVDTHQINMTESRF